MRTLRRQRVRRKPKLLPQKISLSMLSLPIPLPPRRLLPGDVHRLVIPRQEFGFSRHTKSHPRDVAPTPPGRGKFRENNPCFCNISGDGWPDDVRLSDIEAQFVCKTCGKSGADVRSFGSRSRGDIFVSESKFSGDIFPVRSCDYLPRGALLRRRPVKVSNSLFRRGKSDCTAGRRRSRATEPGAEEKSLK